MNATTTSTTPITAENLRALAAAVEALPESVPAPSNIDTIGAALGLKWYLFGSEDHEKQKDAARKIVTAIGGKWDKYDTAELFRFRRNAGPVAFEVIVDRPAVCERVIVATREVTREVPAQEAVEAHTVTETVEDIEWRCQPLLADADDPAATHDADGSPMETYENDGVPA